VRISGTRRAAVPPGTVKVRALLHRPFCWARTTPLAAPADTTALICVSPQFVTCPAALPSQTEPAVDPKPLPLMVTRVPGTPEAGLMPSMCGVSTVKVEAGLSTPFCIT
jgi:hypothetical protein